MNLSDIKIKPQTLGGGVLLGYYCIYTFIARFSHIGGRNADLILIAVNAISAFLLLVTLFINKSASAEKRLNNAFVYWLPFLGVLVFQYLKGYCNTSYLLLFILFILLLMLSNMSYLLCNRIVKSFQIMAVIAVLGTLTQLVIPSLHKIIISVLYTNEGVKYIQSYAQRGYYSGFFYQVGDAAFYLSAGILATFLVKQDAKRRIVSCLLFTLFMIVEGKRSLVVLVLVILLYTYIIQGKGHKRAMRFAVAGLIVMLGWIVVKEISANLSNIILFKKLATTISFLEDGDIEGVLLSSGRSWLYDLAEKLFHENPITGIGWAQFSKISGRVNNQVTSVHNIYLQLLCETGIVGFGSFILAAGTTAVRTIRSYISSRSAKQVEYGILQQFLLLSIAGQLLFLLFGLVENPLYNGNCLAFYFLMVLMGESIMLKLKAKQL